MGIRRTSFQSLGLVLGADVVLVKEIGIFVHNRLHEDQGGLRPEFYLESGAPPSFTFVKLGRERDRICLIRSSFARFV